MYTFKTAIEATTYDQFVQTHPQGNLLQTANWAKVKEEWDAIRTGVYKNDELVGVALVLVRTIKGFKFGYVPRGPVIDYNDTNLVTFYMESLKTLAKQQKWLFVKFDPRIVRRSAPIKTFKESTVLEESVTNVQTLLKSGARYLGLTTELSDTVQPRYEAIIDVNAFNESALTSKVRNYIKSARKKNVTIVSYNESVSVNEQMIENGNDSTTNNTKQDGANLLYSVIQKTMARKNIQLRDANYFRLIQQLYPQQTDISIAQLDVTYAIKQLDDKITTLQTQMTSDAYGERKLKQLKEECTTLEKQLTNLKAMNVDGVAIMSGGLSVSCGHVLEQIYAGFDEQYKQLYPQYLLYASFVDYAKKNELTRVNLGGVENALDGGLTRFKENFNPIIEEYVGEFDLVVSPLYYVFQLALMARKKLKKKN